MSKMLEILGIIIIGYVSIAAFNHVFNRKIIAKGTVVCSVIEVPQTPTDAVAIADCGFSHARYINLSEINSGQYLSLRIGGSIMCPYELTFEPLFPFIGSTSSHTFERTQVPCQQLAYQLRNSRNP